MSTFNKPGPAPKFSPEINEPADDFDPRLSAGDVIFKIHKCELYNNGFSDCFGATGTIIESSDEHHVSPADKCAPNVVGSVRRYTRSGVNKDARQAQNCQEVKKFIAAALGGDPNVEPDGTTWLELADQAVAGDGTALAGCVVRLIGEDKVTKGAGRKIVAWRPMSAR